MSFFKEQDVAGSDAMHTIMSQTWFKDEADERL
jgi:hypothetical protein